ncbi:MAG: metal-sulfur cluster assembly factor [Acidimicrobiia bacterium]|nr:metal-sulfur cluster assembly factor [Acidimicrobiia bacterium]
MTTPSTSPDVVAAAYRALQNVWDPELGLDVVTMGLIYDVRVDESGLVVDMTLTTPGCPVSEQLPQEAGQAVRRALPQIPVQVNLVWDPPWSPERMSTDVLGRFR